MRRPAAAALLALTLALPLALAAGHAAAVQPDEIMTDPALEARARAISALLRCPVCQGETIDESNAPLARDLRILVRERLAAGDSDEQVLAYVEARYGEFILFRPAASGANLILWIAGPAMLLVALAIVARLYRRGAAAAAAGAAAGEDLSAGEEARLKAILGQGEGSPAEVSHDGTPSSSQ
ncbi:MAG: cytochrome c-type biogenesis protein CcmH [Rhodobacteraceae bacterium]|nr:cytochrome c-type biogenesis protein CcmH [Paracoccaceae bacterium]